jgi:hypothetical protein
MRTVTVSAVGVLLSLICSPRPAVGQSNPSGPTLPNSQKLQAPARLFDLPRSAETGSVPLRTDSTNGPANPPQSWMNLAQQNKPSADQFRAELRERIKRGILPQLESSPCAHILILQAPNMDSKIIEEVPRGFNSNMPTFDGWPPCCPDFHVAIVPRDFHGVAPIPPSAPVLAPGTIARLNSLRP